MASERSAVAGSWRTTDEPFPLAPRAGKGRTSARRTGGRSPRAAAVALLLLAWSSTCLIGDVSWGRLSIVPVVLASATPLILLPAVPMATVALRGRHWITAVLTVVAAALPWLFIVGYAAPAPMRPGSATSVRSMLVTARLGAADPRAIVAAVRDHAVDVVVVTELTGTLVHELTVAGLDLALTPRWVALPTAEAPGGGIGIWSRFPCQDFTPVAGTRLPAVTGRLDTGRGMLRLVVAHAVAPTRDGTARWSSDLRAIDTAGHARGPMLVLADLEAAPWQPQFRRVVHGGLHDAADVLGRGMRATWPRWSPVALLPLDHTLVGGGVGVTDLDTLPIAGTDHLALLSTVQVPDSAGRAAGSGASPAPSPSLGAGS